MAAVSTVPSSVLSGTWQIDPAHSSVEFAVKHLVISTVKGRFGDFGGTIVLDETDPSRSSVDVEIQTASLNTHEPNRDEHLRSADFFDVEQYPTMRFSSTSVRAPGDDRYQVDGELTLRGVTQPVQLAVEQLGQGTDPWGKERVAFSATTKLDRKAFGLTWNATLETGGMLVGDEVKVALEIQATRVE